MAQLGREEVSPLKSLQETWVKLRNDAVSGISKIATGLDVQGDSRGGDQRAEVVVQDKLSALRRTLLAVELRVNELDGEQEGEAAQALLETCRDDYFRLRADLRKAKQQAKVNAEVVIRSQREALLGGGEKGALRRRLLQTAAELGGAAEDVTDTLRRTRQIMAQEVERGAATLHVMGESTATLKKAQSEYEGQGSLLSVARRLLSMLQRQDVVERLVLAVGTLLFLLVCVYIVYKRVPLLKKVAPTLWSFSPTHPSRHQQSALLEHTRLDSDGLQHSSLSELSASGHAVYSDEDGPYLVADDFVNPYASSLTADSGQTKDLASSATSSCVIDDFGSGSSSSCSADGAAAFRQGSNGDVSDVESFAADLSTEDSVLRPGHRQLD
eukprot:jgi/Mesen1/728/ME000011S00070